MAIQGGTSHTVTPGGFDTQTENVKTVNIKTNTTGKELRYRILMGHEPNRYNSGLGKIIIKPPIFKYKLLGRK